jgi:hypothetical protein
VLIMSNGAFGGIHDKLIRALHGRKPEKRPAHPSRAP